MKITKTTWFRVRPVFSRTRGKLSKSVKVVYKKTIKPYGVFIGLDSSKISRLNDYKLVVVEPEVFTEKQVSSLHKKGRTVYAYLNIGAIEKTRSYYDEYKDLALGPYEDWPDEYWMDVSQSRWRDFIVDTLAKKYDETGFDGFFLDNTDVYYQYQTDEIYQGLCSIMKGLRKYDKTLIINGGDTFVGKCLDEGDDQALPDGVNQEEVFTSYDFDNSKYGKQDSETTEYYQEYLARVKKTACVSI